MSLSLDSWTSLSRRHFLAVTVHFLDDAFNPHACLLSCAVVDGPMTSDAIQSEVRRVCLAYQVDPSRVMTVVSDNGANVKKAGKALSSLSRHGCAAHVIQLVLVKELLRVGAPYCAVIDKCKNLSTKIKISTNLGREYKRKLEEAGIATTRPVLPVATRWNSTFFMLERLDDTYDAARYAVAESVSMTKCTSFSCQRENGRWSVTWFEFFDIPRRPRDSCRSPCARNQASFQFRSWS